MSDEITELKVNVAVLKTQVEHLTTAVETLTNAVVELTALANKGKGSLWMVLTIGGILGALLGNVKTLVGFLR